MALDGAQLSLYKARQTAVIEGHEIVQPSSYHARHAAMPAQHALLQNMVYFGAPLMRMVPRNLLAHTVWGIQILEEKRESSPFAVPLSLGNQNRRGPKGPQWKCELAFLSFQLLFLS